MLRSQLLNVREVIKEERGHTVTKSEAGREKHLSLTHTHTHTQLWVRERQRQMYMEGLVGHTHVVLQAASFISFVICIGRLKNSETSSALRKSLRPFFFFKLEPILSLKLKF